jgi:hypothetical protein
MFDRTLSLLDQELTNTIGSADRDELLEEMMMDPSIADELRRRERVIYDNLQSDARIRLPNWFSLANVASLLVVAGATLLLAQNLDETPPGLASANVYELDNVRSASPQISTVRVQAGEQWVNFMAYPDFADFTSLVVRIDLHTGDPTQVFSADGSAWRPVWHGVSTVGNRDMLLLTVPGIDLKPGVHRLVVHGVADGKPTTTPIHEVIFALEFSGD